MLKVQIFWDQVKLIRWTNCFLNFHHRLGTTIWLVHTRVNTADLLTRIDWLILFLLSYFKRDKVPLSHCIRLPNWSPSWLFGQQYWAKTVFGQIRRIRLRPSDLKVDLVLFLNWPSELSGCRFLRRVWLRFLHIERHQLLQTASCLAVIFRCSHWHRVATQPRVRSRPFLELLF